MSTSLSSGQAVPSVCSLEKMPALPAASPILHSRGKEEERRGE